MPDISVLLACYNQAHVISDAVAGILRQETGKPFEVVVADDASADGTRELAASLFRDRPDIDVRFLPSDENLGPVGNYWRGFASCRAPLVALLDGDDFWTSTDKLAAQAKVLHDNPGCPLCATNYHFLDTDTGRLSLRVEASAKTTFHTADDIIADNMPGNLSACMYRRSALLSLPAGLQDIRCGDWLLNIAVARHGPLAFLHAPMSVYRRNNGGMWTSMSRPEQIRLLLELVPEYDAVTGGDHHHAFAQAAAALRGELASLGEQGGSADLP